MQPNSGSSNKQLFENIEELPSSGNSGEVAPGPDLSDRPGLEALRAEVYKPAEPTTIHAIAELFDDLYGIIDADDEGNAAEVCQSVIKVIDGLMIIVDMKKLLACSGL